MNEMFELPAQLKRLVDKDLTLSVTRLVAGRTADPIDYILELDRLVHEPVDHRESRFGEIMAELETSLVTTKKQSGTATTTSAVYF